MKPALRLHLALVWIGAILIVWLPAAATADDGDGPVFIGLDAALTGTSGRSGEAIRRGLVLALDEINAAGGVLGARLELIVRDNRGMPDRGGDNVQDLADIAGLVAVLGGAETHVAIAQVRALRGSGLVYLSPWASGIPAADHVFRLTAGEADAGRFLVKAILERGRKRPGLLLWRTAWGRSSAAAMTRAIEDLGIESAGIEWFNTSERDLSKQIERLHLSGADAILLVAGPTEGLYAVQAMAAREKAHRLPIVSHMGLSAGRFRELAGPAVDAVDLTVLQTHSFFEPAFPTRSAAFLEAYCARFGPCEGPADIIAPVGTAQAYDLVHLLKLAIERAGSTDRAAVRAALERLPRHQGLIRVYDPAFTTDRHDALDAGDFRLCRFARNGAIMPLSVAEVN